MTVPAAEASDETQSRDGLWSGAAASPGSELFPVYAAAFAVVAVPAVVVLAVLFGLIPALPWWLGALCGLVVAVAAVWYLAERADRIVLSAIGPALPASQHPPRLTNMVEGLTLAGGVISPSVVVLDDEARNALAVRRRDNNHLVLTSGLLDALDVVELEGAVAELLTRLRNGDAELATVGVALLGRPLIDGPAGVVLAPVASRILTRLLPADRDLEADRQAVTLTRYPPGLLKALEAMEGRDVRPAAVTDGSAHLWLVDPTPAAADDDEQRAPLRLRIDALAEL
jgi:heat shock protein HtpX